ncbi:MAG: SRPBCC domain-containing protein [Methanobacteriota archaeon]|nr:MAG: SRPBCC domain-containing protein [Euryarchaeota archaeon]TLZ66096.1 MAG: SRPBCC domain-containing protein [Euryarchaeota archaeon]
MLELQTETDIDAPVERVWHVLMDFAAYPEWNPFIRSVQGKPDVGSRLEVELGASGTRPMRFRPTVKVVVPNQEFRWLGHLGIRGLFDGEHIFELTPLNAGSTRFVQRERFRGIFLPFLARRLEQDVRRGFEEMNRALRERASRPPQNAVPTGKA